VKLGRWRADQLIFLDESAACERTGVFQALAHDVDVANLSR